MRVQGSRYRVDGLAKIPNPVSPAKAGVQKLLKRLDSGSLIGVRDKLRRNDNKLMIQA